MAAVESVVGRKLFAEAAGEPVRRHRAVRMDLVAVDQIGHQVGDHPVALFTGTARAYFVAQQPISRTQAADSFAHSLIEIGIVLLQRPLRLLTLADVVDQKVVPEHLATLNVGHVIQVNESRHAVRVGDFAFFIDGEPFIVPLAIPYVAGPSVLAVEMLLMSNDPANWPTWLLAVTAAWAVTSVVVFFGSQVAERLGPRGLIAIERLMGMILVAIAIQMFLTGADTYFGRV